MGRLLNHDTGQSQGDLTQAFEATKILWREKSDGDEYVGGRSERGAGKSAKRGQAGGKESTSGGSCSACGSCDFGNSEFHENLQHQQVESQQIEAAAAGNDGAEPSWAHDHISSDNFDTSHELSDAYEADATWVDGLDEQHNMLQSNAEKLHNAEQISRESDWWKSDGGSCSGGCSSCGGD